MNKIGVIGLGYVGLPLMLALVKAGKTVIGYDLDERVVNDLNEGGCHLSQWTRRVEKEIKPGVNAKFTCDSSDLLGVDAAVICVPTPLTVETPVQPDHSYVEAVMKSISALKVLPSLIILESTVSVGYTSTVCQQIFGKNLKLNGGSLHVCFSPEREDPGNGSFTNVEIPKVIGGMTGDCLQKGVELYMDVFEHVVRASTLEAAELCKLHENTFRAVNIIYVNQFRDFASKHGVNFEEVINLAKSKPFGFMPFNPGIGVGGHCIPVDPYFLMAVAEKESGGLSLVRHVMNEIEKSAASTFHWIKECGVEGELLITGASYKDGVADTRCSPSIQLMELLADKYKVSFWDRNVEAVDIKDTKLYSVDDSYFAHFKGTVIVVNQAGKNFIDQELLRASRILDARYRVELTK